jgi:hypothetical protein
MAIPHHNIPDLVLLIFRHQESRRFIKNGNHLGKGTLKNPQGCEELLFWGIGVYQSFDLRSK